jgi:putative transposase
MSKENYKYSSHCVHNINYHIVWCTKYRREVITSDIEKSLKALLIGKAFELNIEIKQMETMPDHVHLFVSCTPLHTPKNIVQHFKGFTSKRLRELYPELKYRLPSSLWTKSYFCESIGCISEQTIKKYIQNQKLQ